MSLVRWEMHNRPCRLDPEYTTTLYQEPTLTSMFPDESFMSSSKIVSAAITHTFSSPNDNGESHISFFIPLFGDSPPYIVEIFGKLEAEGVIRCNGMVIKSAQECEVLIPALCMFWEGFSKTLGLVGKGETSELYRLCLLEPEHGPFKLTSLAERMVDLVIDPPEKEFTAEEIVDLEFHLIERLHYKPVDRCSAATVVASLPASWYPKPRIIILRRSFPRKVLASS
jgi:hypothetical protein